MANFRHSENIGRKGSHFGIRIHARGSCLQRFRRYQCFGSLKQSSLLNLSNDLREYINNKVHIAYVKLLNSENPPSVRYNPRERGSLSGSQNCLGA